MLPAFHSVSSFTGDCLRIPYEKEIYGRNTCGIRPITNDPAARGFHRFRLEPMPGHELKSASASYLSSYGKIESAWERKENELVWTFSVPCNTTAEVVFPCPADRVPETPGITFDAEKKVWIAVPGKYTVAIPYN